MHEHNSISSQLSAAVATAANETPVEQLLAANICKKTVKGSPVQSKYSIGASNDPLEYEANALADTVMRMPETNFIQRKCAHCEEKEKMQRKPLASFIQKKENACSGVASNTVTNQIQSTKGGGNSIPETTKSFMENRFGADFSKVHLHTGNYAAKISKGLNAQAFTVGNDIYFNENKYAPETNNGKHLLAHELTHVMQQSNFNNKPHIARFTDQTN